MGWWGRTKRMGGGEEGNKGGEEVKRGRGREEKRKKR